MDVLFGLLIAFHVLVAVTLVTVILLQPSKAEGGLGTAFGGGSASSVFGGRGATTFLSKATGVLVAIFLVLSVAISLIGSERTVTDQASVTTTPQQQSQQ